MMPNVVSDINQLPEKYDPTEIEHTIYEWWEREGYFKPEKQLELGLVNRDSKSYSRYCLTLPPPNVTGALHLGHAIMAAIEDLMSRFERMRGKETLFLPGTDHAGIATQNVVERELSKQGISRKELSREEFVEHVWEWKHKYHARITEQSKRLGMSSDWSRERFTLDEQYEQAVLEAFVRLYHENLIYRGNYLVNWCPRCESAISDLEAQAQEHPGHLWYIRYPVITEDWPGPFDEWGSGNWAKGATEFIEVATTRPETLLGDTAVATSKEHDLFGRLIGKIAVLPVLGRNIPIIIDELVDPNFGTGAVKITPAHDPNDYEIGKKHHLEYITVMDEKGCMLVEYAGPYAGMDRYECREAIVADLKKEGLLTKVEPYLHSIAHCQRCSTVIEPRISLQWFVKTKPLAEAAMARVRNNETVIIPDREKKNFFQWMENIRDWTISRQLWWGHRIPVWYCPNGHIISQVDSPGKCPDCGSNELMQDEDVLDTWFSSGLWPFATLGWPNEESLDYQRFYPTDMRETGYDILFFWVAREMMLAEALTGKTPFRTIYLHGIIRSEHGTKISKSMDNIADYDPLNIIAQYGADSLRYTLVTNAVPGLDMNLDTRRLIAARRFCNKIWQSTRFVLGNLNDESSKVSLPGIDEYDLSQFYYTDRWILSRLNRLINDVTAHMEEYDYLNAGREIKTFYWNEFCDWYLETTKIRIYSDQESRIPALVVLLHVLETSFRLLHPFMPHMTEALWQTLPESWKGGPALIVTSWPEVYDKFIDDPIESDFSLIQDLIQNVRSALKQFNVPLNKPIPILITTDDSDKRRLIQNSQEEIIFLARLDDEAFQITDTLPEPPKHSARILLPELTAYIPLEGLVDLDKEQKRIQKQLEKVKKQILQLQKKLASPFVEKADPQLVEHERNRLVELEEKQAQVAEQLSFLI